ncbi:hypothetical protein LBMAG56_21670 [Verrucomicrobiota bacterium]|nr:hypothetical protein LBMAG56_21670 [Verrucomicrobiota bacterium]
MARTKKENGSSSPYTATIGAEAKLWLAADMLSELDWSVGKVMKTLERLGLSKNTLVIFSSDNGASPINEDGHLPNGPWRGKKSQLWEGGHREPFIARWPGHIAPGTTADDLVCLVDLAATAAAVAGEKLPDGAAPDSFNLLPTLLGQPKQMKRDTLVVMSGNGDLAKQLLRLEDEVLDIEDLGDSVSLTEFTLDDSGLQSGRGFVLPNAREQVHEKTDIELVTWLVIKGDKV